MQLQTVKLGHFRFVTYYFSFLSVVVITCLFGNMSVSSVSLPLGDAQMDLYADQRGRIIGSCVAIFVITDVFVLLRLVSRKLARAGYWVSLFGLKGW